MATPQRIRKVMPIAGLRSAWPASELNPTDSPRCLNVRFRFGEVREGPGRSLLAGPAASEDALAITRFPLLDGTEWATLHTETNWFRWGNGTPGTPRQWHRVPTPAMTFSRRPTLTVGETYQFRVQDGNDVLRWDGAPGSNAEVIPDAGTWDAATGGSADHPRARYGMYFNNRLILGWTLENGENFSTRIRWPKNADHTDWSGSGSGFLDLSEGDEEAIQGFCQIGGRLTIVRRNSLVDLIPTGILDPVFDSEVRVRGRGCIAPDTIRSTGQVMFFLGHDANVYAWDGVNLTAVGDPVWEELKGLTNPSGMYAYTAAVSTYRQEYWLVLENGDVFVYDYGRGTWTRDSFPAITAVGEVTDTLQADTYDSVTSTYDSDARTYDAAAGVSQTVLWAGRPDGATFTVDEQVAYDYFTQGSIVDRYVETPDFYIIDQDGQPNPDRNIRLHKLLIESRPTPANDEFLVGISMDRGTTWTEQMASTNANGFTALSLNQTGNCVRFRFREQRSDAEFRWRAYSYEFQDDGPWNGTN